MNNEKTESAYTWNTVMCECPYCGHIQETDAEIGDEDFCEKCGKVFILKDFDGEEQ